MDCKTAKRQIILDLYGDLGEKEKAGLDNHLRKCRVCAEELAATKKIFSLLDEHKSVPAPEADWEQAWGKIRAGISSKAAQSRRAFFPRWRWAFAASTLIFVLIAGIFIGRYWFAPRSQLEPTAAKLSPSPNGIRSALAAHLDDLKPILLEYAHYVSSENGSRKISVDENIVRGLLLQNVLLKRRLAKTDPTAADLLEDLDLVLKEIANRKDSDSQSPSQIKNLIEQRGILFKMEILKKL